MFDVVPRRSQMVILAARSGRLALKQAEIAMVGATPLIVLEKVVLRSWDLWMMVVVRGLLAHKGGPLCSVDQSLDPPVRCGESMLSTSPRNAFRSA